MTLDFILKIEYNVKYRGFIICSEILAIVRDYFGMRANVILGRYPVPRPSCLNLTLNVNYKAKGHERVS